MENIHTQFNSKYIEPVIKFCASSSDILLFYAPSGTGKNNIINQALDSLGDDVLRFYYFCDSLTVIEDFLLSFYDTLRDYTIQKKIVLKKDISDDFTQKVSNYMKAITKNTVIVIDNYEKIEDNESITKFLSNISRQEKTKLILLSRKNVSLMNFQLDGLKTVRLEKQVFEEDSVIRQISLACPADELDSLRKLYRTAEGNSLLIQTTASYINTTNTRLYALFDEFQKKGGTFDVFITNKILSLIPQNYLSTIKTLSIINFLPTKTYLAKYKLIDMNSIPYLQQKLIINQINQNVYELEHIKNFVLKELSASDKLQYGELIVKSLNNELSKAPKDRTLRLSREGLRKQIEALQNYIPQVNPNALSNSEVSYYSQSRKPNAPWLKQNGMPRKAPLPSQGLKSFTQKDAEMLKQIRQKTFDNLVQEKETQETESKLDLIQKIRDYEHSFDFQNAINLLERLIKIDREDENQILEKIAENYSKLGKNEDAIEYYVKASDNYKNQNDKTNYFKIILKIADVRLKIYDLNSASKIYYKVINEDSNIENIICAYRSLGSIEEKKNNQEGALENYNDALGFALEYDLNEKASEIYYLIGSINEKQNRIDEAKENYANAIKYGEDNPTLPDSYSAFAFILFEESNMNDAIECYEMAIEKYKNSKKPNLSSLYSANIGLSNIYKTMGSNKEEQYLIEALKFAVSMKDRFETANTFVALGDFYYSASLNKKALYNYLKAKDVLNEDKNSQNQRMILSRMADIKLKMGNNFDAFIREYEQRKQERIRKRT